MKSQASHDIVEYQLALYLKQLREPDLLGQSLFARLNKRVQEISVKEIANYMKVYPV